MTPEVIAAICADYRASFHLDQQHDIEDLQLGRRISAPTLVVVGEDEEQLADAYEIWDDWVEELSYKQVPGGHFLPEETPHELARAVREFLTA
jgi:haloacetate dehalogenase